MSEQMPEIRDGMEVVGSDGERVGRVTEVRASDFLVQRNLRPDLYVVRAAVARIRGDQVVLTVPAGQLLALDQAYPAIHGLAWVGTAPNVAEVSEKVESPVSVPPHQPWHDLLQPGQVVVTLDGVEIGTVKEVDAQRFLVNRSFARDVWIPDRFVDHLSGATVTLGLTEAGFERADLPEPPLG